MSRKWLSPLNVLAGTVDPSTPTLRAGDLFYNTSTAQLRIYSGSAWANVDAGGAGANPIIQVEVNLGATAAKQGKFTLSDAQILGTSDQIYIQQAADVPTGKGTRTDEAEMDDVSLRAVATGVGTGLVYWSSPSFVKGNFKFNWRAS